MPTPYQAPGILLGAEAEDRRTLQNLVDDLHRYAAERGPTPEELAAAPLISDVVLVADPVAVRLAGIVTGHPLVGPGRAVTSRIYAIDPQARWVRSYSRLWRVDGLCFDQFGASLNCSVHSSGVDR
ncbi:DUF6634 family protein [Jiella avicenniae]|uniref:Uncharacterized protein n=1 Tax=Jiella avicenniae TaxID=2907202 RepID=A0A9X1P0Y0_9HYPH|nr:DUF6634 family protein [Jiella avicenniae]MCE7028096.1 hypothetical protein [Jiella avicenniae]